MKLNQLSAFFRLLVIGVDGVFQFNETVILNDAINFFIVPGKKALKFICAEVCTTALLNISEMCVVNLLESYKIFGYVMPHVAAR